MPSKYIIADRGPVTISQVINDCESALCVPTVKGESLTSVLNKLCNKINQFQPPTIITSGKDEKTRVSLNDSIAGFLNGKLVAGSNITFTENNDGGNETLTISSTGGGGSGDDELVKISSNDTTSGYLNGKLVAGGGITFTENNDGLNETLTIAHADTSSVSNLDTSGSEIIDTLTFDTYGHVQTVTTRNLLSGDLPSLNSLYWSLLGNGGTTPATVNFLGTTDLKGIAFRVNNTWAGGIGVGTNLFGDYEGGLVALGYKAAQNMPITTKAEVVAIGANSLQNYLGGNNLGMVAVGTGALRESKTGERNTAVGEYAGFQGWAGDHDTWIGAFAGEVQSGGSFNAGLGAEALRGKKQGSYNTGAGGWALLRATTIVDTVTIDSGGSGYTTATATFSAPETASPGTLSILATGTVTLNAGVVTGVTVTNHGSGYSNEKSTVIVTITGDGTGATGTVVLRSPVGLTALGFAAGWLDFSGAYNTYVGTISGNIQNYYDTYNTFVGYAAARDSSIPATTALTNASAFGYNAHVSTSNTMIFGGIGADAVKVGIGKITATETLDLVGNLRFSGALMPNNLPGTSLYLLQSQGAATAPIWSSLATVLGNTAWLTAGNTGTSVITNFIGTTDLVALSIRTNSTERIKIASTGELGIGVAPTGGTILNVGGSLQFVGVGTGLYRTEAGYTNSINPNASYRGFPNITFLTGSGSAGNEGTIQIASGAGNVYIGTTDDIAARNLVIQNFQGKKPIIFQQQAELARFSETNGNFLIGSSTDVSSTYKLQVTGDSYYTGAIFFTGMTNLSTQDRLIGQFSTSGQLGYITLGSGLSLSPAGTLIATGTGGTVTSFSAGNLSPLFVTSVATPTTTPALTFALSNAAGGTVFGNNTGISAAPAYISTPVLGIAGTTLGTLGLAGNTSGVITIKGQAAAGTYNYNLPINAGASFQVQLSGGGGASPMTWATLTDTATVNFTSASTTISADVIIGGLDNSQNALLVWDGTNILQRDVPSILNSLNIASGRIIWVDAASPNATDTRGSYSRHDFAHPYQTIQAAVTDFDNADTIIVLAGDYTEAVSRLSIGDDFRMIYINATHTTSGGAALTLDTNKNDNIEIYLINSSILTMGESAFVITGNWTEVTIAGNLKPANDRTGTSKITGANVININSVDGIKLILKNLTISSDAEAIIKFEGGVEHVLQMKDCRLEAFTSPIYGADGFFPVLNIDSCSLIGSEEVIKLDLGTPAKANNILWSNSYLKSGDGWDIITSTDFQDNNSASGYIANCRIDAGVTIWTTGGTGFDFNLYVYDCQLVSRTPADFMFSFPDGSSSFSELDFYRNRSTAPLLDILPTDYTVVTITYDVNLTKPTLQVFNYF